jgi:hypothetical protein
MLKNKFNESKVITFAFVGTIFANLKNRLISIRMVSIHSLKELSHEVYGDTLWWLIGGW